MLLTKLWIIIYSKWVTALGTHLLRKTFNQELDIFLINSSSNCNYDNQNKVFSYSTILKNIVNVMELFKYTCNIPFRVISSGSRGKGEPIISFNAISGSL